MFHTVAGGRVSVTVDGTASRISKRCSSLWDDHDNLGRQGMCGGDPHMVLGCNTAAMHIQHHGEIRHLIISQWETSTPGSAMATTDQTLSI